MGLRGLIFDFDGTLADTVPLCIAAFRAASEPLLGRPVSDHDIVSTFGPSEDGAVHRLVPHAPDDCLAEYLRHYERLHPEMAPEPFPGMVQALEELHAMGLKLGLVTGKGQGTLDISMRVQGLAGHFDEMRAGCPERVCKAEKMREIVDLWGFEPAEVGYVGDVPKDVVSSREAGCLALSAGWAETADCDALKAAHPDAFFTEVEDLVRWAKRMTEA